MWSLVSFVFFLSGFSSLIYQVVWQRLMTLYYGVGHVSTTVIISVFMLGLGVGAFWGGKIADRSKNKVIVFALIQFLIGIFGVLSLSLLKWLGAITAGSNYVFVFIYSSLFLLIPTTLMGATLPILVSFFTERKKSFSKSLSGLYFINTLGAALGCLIAAYVLITFWGFSFAVYTAAVINIVLAFIMFVTTQVLRKPLSAENSFQDDKHADRQHATGAVSFGFSLPFGMTMIFLTGFIALGYEIVWFRILSIITQSSPYSFASTLFVYLFGVALGSLGMALILKDNSSFDRKNLFFIIQTFIAVFVGLSMIGLFYAIKHTPFADVVAMARQKELHPFFLSISSANGIFRGFSFNSQNMDIFLWPFYLMFVPTLLMGASFPLINALVYEGRRMAGSTVGILYFVNILGNVLGSLLTGFLLIPLLNSLGTVTTFVIAGLCFGFFMGTRRSLWRTVIKISVILALIVSVFVFMPSNRDFYEAIHFPKGGVEINQIKEGQDAVVITAQTKQKYAIYISGLGHGSLPGYDYVYEALEVMAYARQKTNVLIIGVGIGNILETVLKVPGVERVVAIEIAPTVLDVLREEKNREALFTDPRVEFIMDDARRYLLRTNETFDVVLMDPLRSSTSYSTSVYSRDFFDLVRAHLEIRGVLGLYNCNDLAIMPKTVSVSFPFFNAYGFFIVASQAPLERDRRFFAEILTKMDPIAQINMAQRLKTKDVLFSQKDEQKYKHCSFITDDVPIMEYYLGTPDSCWR